jgi:hypothetical protein
MRCVFVRKLFSANMLNPNDFRACRVSIFRMLRAIRRLPFFATTGWRILPELMDFDHRRYSLQKWIALQFVARGEGGARTQSFSS